MLSTIGRTILLGALGALSTATAATEFQVTNNGNTSYLIDGEANPSLTFQRGSTYIFHINTPGHPFWINTAQFTGTANAYNTGVTNNGTTSGDLTFIVPGDAPNGLFYNCQFHAGMTATITIEGTVATIDRLPRPAGFRLYGNYPNPFNPSSTIRYDLPEATRVTLAIYDVMGREVARLVDGSMEPGAHSVEWNGQDQAGRGLPSGVYIVNLTTPQDRRSIRMMLLK